MGQVRPLPFPIPAGACWFWHPWHWERGLEWGGELELEWEGEWEWEWSCGGAGCSYCNPIFVAAMFLTLTKWLRLLLWHFSLQQPHKQRTKPTRHPNTNTSPKHKHKHTMSSGPTNLPNVCQNPPPETPPATRNATQFPLTRSVLNKLLDCHYQTARLISINLFIA